MFGVDADSRLRICPCLAPVVVLNLNDIDPSRVWLLFLTTAWLWVPRFIIGIKKAVFAEFIYQSEPISDVCSPKAFVVALESVSVSQIAGISTQLLDSALQLLLLRGRAPTLPLGEVTDLVAAVNDFIRHVAWGLGLLPAR